MHRPCGSHGEYSHWSRRRGCQASCFQGDTRACVQEWKTELWKQIKRAYKVCMELLKKLGDAFTGRMCQQLHWLHTRSSMSQFSALCFSSFLWLFRFYLPFDFSPDDWWLVKYRNHFGHLAFCLYLFLRCWGHLLVITFSFFSTKNINAYKKKTQKVHSDGELCCLKPDIVPA